MEHFAPKEAEDTTTMARWEKKVSGPEAVQCVSETAAHWDRCSSAHPCLIKTGPICGMSLHNNSGVAFIGETNYGFHVELICKSCLGDPC